MVLAFPSLPFLITSSILLLFVLQILKNRTTRSKSKLPPGPWTLPFIGSLHHLATARLPHHALRELAQSHGPVMLLRAGEIDLIVLTSREAAKEVLKTQDARLANRPPMIASNLLGYGCTDIVFSNGTYWRQLRRICTTELFSSKQVKSFSSIRREEINSLLKSFALFPDKSPVNVSAMISELSNNIVIRAAFGGKFKDRELLLEIMREVLECFSGFNLFDLFPSFSWLDVNTRRKFVRLHSKFDSVLEEILKEHLKKQQQQLKKKGDEVAEYDLVDVLFNVKENGDFEEPITMDTIKSVILDVLFAGTESSATAITWAMTELIRHPKVMAKAQAELRQAAIPFIENSLDYLKLVIKETLRMHPPAPLLVPRLCHDSCQILGYTIPSGARIIVNAWALGRNPIYWDDPDDFKPERFETSAIDFKGQNFEFLPFGAGRRICPGLEFSLTLVEEALAKMLLHFDWELSNGMKPNNLDMMETFGISAAKKEPLFLIPTLRVPLPAGLLDF